LPMVLDLHQRAVLSRVSESQNRAVINPGMTGNYPVRFAWTKLIGGQGGG
jgi:hypothetical protein